MEYRNKGRVDMGKGDINFEAKKIVEYVGTIFL